MKIGDLRHRIQLQAPTDYQDEFGQPVRSWTTYATVWAQVNESGASESVDGMQLNASAVHSILVRYRSDIQSNHRILWGERILNISTPPRDPDGTRIGTVLVAQEALSMAAGVPS